MSQSIRALIVVAAVAGCSPVVPVDVVPVEEGEIRTYVEERAKTRLPEIYRITMPLDGRIRPIALKEDDRVQQGDVVAEIDPADLQTDLAGAVSQVAEYEQILAALTSTIESAQAQVRASNAKLEFSAGELKRIRELAKVQAVSASQESSAELLEIESRIEVEKDTSTVKAAAAIRAAMQLLHLDSDEKRKRRQRDRDRAELKSPVDGVVLRRHISNRQVLPAGEVLLEIGRLEDLEVETEILTQDVVSIAVGDRVDIAGAGIGPTALGGTVARIYPQGFTKVSSLGVEQQRVLVIIKFDPEQLVELKRSGWKLGVDYRVRVRIYTGRRTGALKIPRSALFRGVDGAWQAYAVRDGRAVLVKLQVGLINDFEAEVVSGLKAGEPVILAPESSLADGRRVEPHLVNSD